MKEEAEAKRWWQFGKITSLCIQNFFVKSLILSELRKEYENELDR